MVGILVLVHQNIAEFPLIIVTDVLIFQQQLDGNIDDIVKVQSVVILQPGLILHVSSCNVERTDIAGGLRSVQHLLRRNHLIFLLADSAQDILGREGLVIQTHILDDFLHNPLGIRGVVDGKAPGVTHPLNVPPQDPAAGAVESHSPDILCFRTQKDGKTFFQLVGGLIGESDGHNAPGNSPFQGAEVIRPPTVIFIHIVVQRLQKGNILFRDGIGNFVGVTATAETHNVGDSIDQNSGLAAACTGKEKQRALCGQNRLLLHIIQFLKLLPDVSLPGIQETDVQIFAHSRTSP